MTRVRCATSEDWPRMIDIFVAAGRAAWPHILSSATLEALSPPERWHQAIEDPAQRVLIADNQGNPDAFAVLRPSADSDADETIGELDSFYAHPEIWGKGVGRSLLAEAHQELIAMGFRQATLWTAELNHRPRSIYERSGWRLDGTTRNRSLRGSDFVELRYRIILLLS